MKQVKDRGRIISIGDFSIINRLEAPYRSNCSNGEEDMNIFPGPYTREKCRDTLVFLTAHSFCRLQLHQVCRQVYLGLFTYVKLPYVKY